MKRYRVMHNDFDYRANMLAFAIKEEWDEKVRLSHLQNRERLISQFRSEFGEFNIQMKLRNAVELGASADSVIAFHNKFLHQARSAFIPGSYYPALTGACSLGERILNHLVLNLRDHYKTSRIYKNIYRKSSFDDWRLAIEALSEWGVFREEISTLFTEMSQVRNRAIHFHPATDTDDRALALDALKLLTKAVAGQFGSSGELPWLFGTDGGVSFIRKEWEYNKFVQLVYISNSIHVGPYHELEYKNHQFSLKSDANTTDIEISDEEYLDIFTRKNC